MKPTSTESPNFVRALQRADAWSHPVSAIKLVETHISWVFLTGEYAYKIKKPVNFGFLDFSSLDKRLHSCREEVRLNQRQAPEIYLDVVPLCGSPERPRVGGAGEAFEYAVRMRQFEVGRGFDHLLASGLLTTAHMDQTAAMLARFQDETEVAGTDSCYGTAAAVREPVAENFHQIKEYLQHVDSDSPLHHRLQHLEQWSLDRFRQLEAVIAQRQAMGFVREGHGDLHLRNIIHWNGRVIPFDCIEFNANLRWIDTISELSFLLMDLDDHQCENLSRRLLNAWLECTGDYDGLQLLRFYKVYRAMVRAKVASLRLLQLTAGQAAEAHEFFNYVELAESYTRVRPARLIITHGLSGSGKTWLSQQLLEASPFIRLRSDVERKRLFGLQQASRTGAEKLDMYQPAASERTYKLLLDKTEKMLGWGYAVIVDAAFLRYEQRQMFAELAQRMQVPFAIVHCEADEGLTRERLLRREQDNSDASDAGVVVYEQQLHEIEPLAGSELDHRLPAELAILLNEEHA